ncbi:MAG: ABC transporter permease [Rhodobiaceae bacterium]|nr:ABC transporter permease [Rhodobiaceae bacterium]
MKVGEAGRWAVARLQWVLPLLVLIALWEAAVRVLGIAPYMLPAPSRVAARLYEDAGLLFHHGFITAFEIVLGLAVGIVAGVATATLMAITRLAERLAWPLVVATQALPVFAIAPLLVLWFGFGLGSKIVMAALIIFFPVVSATHDGLTRTDQGLIDIARLTQAPRLRVLWLLRLPAALPAMASGIRIAAAIAPIGAVVGEWVGASAGLGYLMLHANARLQTDLVFAALVILAFIAIGIRSLAGALTRRMIPWADERDIHVI